VRASRRRTTSPCAGLLTSAFFCLVLLLPLTAAATSPTSSSFLDRRVSAEEKAAVARLPEKYRSWLEEVDVLISEEERATFLALEKDYQRDAFIKRFWEVRDPLPRTARNELEDRWDGYVRQARDLFGD